MMLELKNMTGNKKTTQMGSIMKRVSGALLFVLITGCVAVDVVSPYDEVIDNGLQAYKESINTLAMNLSDSAGKKEGTFEENREKYNALEAKINLLIDRAAIQSSGKGCKLTTDVTAKVEKIMGDNMPLEAEQKDDGDSYGCTERLLILVKQQLLLLQQIHKETDKCTAIGIREDEDAEPSKISCLRPATSKTAMKITNQSINAAWVVETAKKTEREYR